MRKFVTLRQKCQISLYRRRFSVATKESLKHLARNPEYLDDGGFGMSPKHVNICLGTIDFHLIKKGRATQMARVKIQSIIEHLDYDMKRALEDAVSHVLPDADVDRAEIYREFRRAVGRKCSTWVNVPDSDILKVCCHCRKET